MRFESAQAGARIKNRQVPFVGTVDDQPEGLASPDLLQGYADSMLGRIEASYSEASVVGVDFVAVDLRFRESW